jgi:hypothetical protein
MMFLHFIYCCLSDIHHMLSYVNPKILIGLFIRLFTNQSFEIKYYPNATPINDDIEFLISLAYKIL